MSQHPLWSACEVKAAPIVQKSLTDTVEERIREMIVSGALEFGQQITERQLADQFDVSKTPVREAMARLVSEGLLEVKPRTGNFVFSPTEGVITQITDLRRLLECGALKSALRHDRDGLLAELRDNVARSRHVHESDDPSQSYRKLDNAFHATLFAYADNPYLSQAYDVIAHKVRAMRNRLTFPPAFIRVSLAQHEEVVDLLENDRVGEAVMHLDYHIGASFSDRARRLLASGA
ncbi:GntR family transcriptional regulator [Pleomorphomonas sp. NRK KF1]|uniref:GntR family transcriptional regulator n=1 Tax=Pleomorphomonas sp. NRK KF1 TaxID=2943000 RepID=UPI002043EA6F|nr:GntR family transcriptional regulator [Pleomorphomonas sp. NRK KF1]MCM5553865.1 GntR family transcriptional regulator [Pleomorphomonas sp. NRK KF1]